MAKILVYTSPARGHLFPITGAALELQSRGHEVHIRSLSSELDRLRAFGLEAEAIAPGLEARELDDWRGKNSLESLELSMKTFGDRAMLEVDDVKLAIRQSGAEGLLIDTNSWGAQAVAEASGLPWALFQPYFTALPAPGVPPFGPGLARSTGLFGKVRDSFLGRMIFSKMNGWALPQINEARRRVGLAPLDTITELMMRPPRVFYFTAEEFEYPRESWPPAFRFVGPGNWSPHAEPPEWLSDIKRSIVLVTCSTERQSDRGIIEAALESLPDQGFYVVATSAAYSPRELRVRTGPYSRLERFIPHDPIIDRANVVICHGGMGTTQRALSRGVPLVVIPFGRDQLEVARRVEYAAAGVRLLPNRLNAESLQAAVRKARSMKKGAERIAGALTKAGAYPALADSFEELLLREKEEIVLKK